MQTTLLFFNAIGGGGNNTGPPFPVPGSGIPVIGSRDTLREFMAFYGVPRAGDWVTSGGSGTASATPGQLELDAFDGDENFLGSFRLSPACFERVRLGALIPVLTNAPLGHVVAFSLKDFSRDVRCLDGRCAFSGFQETTVEAGAVDLIFSGYFHHSSATDENSQPLRPGN
jgi:hypothetical protein